LRQDRVFLKHILEEINFLLDKTKGLEYESLIRDETLKRAFLRSLEIIGEATKNISVDFRNSHPEVKWRELAGLRDKLIHAYFGVKWEIVWDVIKNFIPKLRGQIETLLLKAE